MDIVLCVCGHGPDEHEGHYGGKCEHPDCLCVVYEEEEVESDFDYEVIATCEWPVTDLSKPELEGECEEPAPYLGTWYDSDNGAVLEEMNLCEKHLELAVKERLNRIPW